MNQECQRCKKLDEVWKDDWDAENTGETLEEYIMANLQRRADGEF